MATDPESLSRGIREWIAARSARLDNNSLISGGLVVVLVYLCVIPIVAIAYSSLTAEGLQFTTGEYSLRNWFLLAEQVPVISNTVVYGLGSTVLTVALAVSIGWVISRTNTPLSNVYYYTAFVAFFLPPVTWERVWIRIWGRNGIVPAALDVPTLHIQSIPGMIVIQAVRLVPFGLIILMPLLQNFDKTLEEVSFISGSGLKQTTKDITLPILKPGIATFFILALIISLASVRVPLVIGLPEKIHVLPTEIYSATTDSPLRYGLAMADALILVAISLPLLLLYKRIRGRVEQYRTVSGRGYTSGEIDLGWWKYPTSFVVGTFLLVTIVVPTLLMFYVSVLEYYVPPRLFEWSLVTTDGYAYVFSDPTIQHAVSNSVIVALSATFISIVFGLVVAWVLSTDVPLQTPIDYLSFTPLAIPPIALAVGLMFIYLNWVRIGVYGTVGIMIIAYFTRTLPVSVRVINPAVIQIDRSLLEIGELSGMSRTGRIKAIILPLISGTVQALFVTMFAYLYFEFPIAILLSSAELPLVSSQLYLMQIEGLFTESAALGSVMMIFLILFTALTARFGVDL